MHRTLGNVNVNWEEYDSTDRLTTDSNDQNKHIESVCYFIRVLGDRRLTSSGKYKKFYIICRL